MAEPCGVSAGSILIGRTVSYDCQSDCKILIGQDTNCDQEYDWAPEDISYWAQTNMIGWAQTNTIDREFYWTPLDVKCTHPTGGYWWVQNGTSQGYKIERTQNDRRICDD